MFAPSAVENVRELHCVRNGRVVDVAAWEYLSFYTLQKNNRHCYRFDCAKAPRCTELRLSFCHVAEVNNLPFIGKQLTGFVAYNLRLCAKAQELLSCFGENLQNLQIGNIQNLRIEPIARFFRPQGADTRYRVLVLNSCTIADPEQFEGMVLSVFGPPMDYDFQTYQSRMRVREYLIIRDIMPASIPKYDH